MNGKLGFVESFKETMQLTVSQRITKGISSMDVNCYLRWLRSTYKSTGREMTFVWKRVQKVDSKSRRSFDGSSVYKLLSGGRGQYVLFGKAKWNNDLHRRQLKRLRSLSDERSRFILYGLSSKGRKVADHAVGLTINDTSDHLLYDNSMRNISVNFNAEALASKMSDVSSCYIFDVQMLPSKLKTRG